MEISKLTTEQKKQYKKVCADMKQAAIDQTAIFETQLVKSLYMERYYQRAVITKTGAKWQNSLAMAQKEIEKVKELIAESKEQVTFFDEMIVELGN